MATAWYSQSLLLDFRDVSGCYGLELGGGSYSVARVGVGLSEWDGWPC